LLASMKDESGRVLVEHFLRRHRAAERGWKARGRGGAGHRRRAARGFWLGSSEGAPRKLAELITRPR
jgi:hypothetical protein